MKTLVCHPAELERDPICHIEPVQLSMKELCQTAVVLPCAAHDSRCSVHDSLQLVDDRMTGSLPPYIRLQGGSEPVQMLCSSNSRGSSYGRIFFSENLAYITCHDHRGLDVQLKTNIGSCFENICLDSLSFLLLPVAALYPVYVSLAPALVTGLSIELIC